MSVKSTWYWLLLAAGLFAFIFFYQRHVRPEPPGPALILPKLETNRVTVVHVHSASAGEIRADRTNGTWTLIQPLVYPADGAAVDKLLSALAQLTPAGFLSESELRAHPNADEEYGLASPQISLIVTQYNYRAHVLIGKKTPPGDQVYLRVVAEEGLYLVDAGLLQAIPGSAADWRDRELLHGTNQSFDRVAVTNAGKSLVVGRDSTNQLWRIVWPLFQARADTTRIRDGLEKLATARVQEFVSDDPKADLDSYGLQSPELEVAVTQATNPPVLLQFGKSPTNHAGQVYARWSGRNTIVTVEKARLAPWRIASANDFRDPHLLELGVPVDRIEARGEDAFTLSNQTNGAWRVEPKGYPADLELVTGLISTLTNMEIVRFEKDVVTPLDLPKYGLAAPARDYVLETAATNHSGLATNEPIARLSFGFGTNETDKVYARRADEESVYAISTNDFARLPAASWQMRERRFWKLTADDLLRLTIRQRGKTRELERRGDHQWSLAFGSQGIIEEAAIEESVRNLLSTPALDWVAVGQTNKTRFGFGDESQQLTFTLKDGQKRTIEFGGAAPGNAQYAAVTLDGELWIMELPFGVYRYVMAYLSLPPGL